MELDYKTGSAPASRQLRARASMSYPKMLLHFIQVALFSPIALYQAVQQCATICDCSPRASPSSTGPRTHLERTTLSTIGETFQCTLLFWRRHRKTKLRKKHNRPAAAAAATSQRESSGGSRAPDLGPFEVVQGATWLHVMRHVNEQPAVRSVGGSAILSGA